ncbi:MAG: hypothetical protein JST12_05265 [Armatimonadetes bacterium]|nr:hypothetical protein [Armatimonadota bacterium]
MTDDPSTWPESLDALIAAPEHHRLLLENDRVRVVETFIPPGERTAVHTHCWPGALYIVSWTAFIRYDDQGNQLFDSRTANPTPANGSIAWSPPLGPHYVHNIGDAPLHVVATELKS